MATSIKPPFYPIVYVRGYAMTENEREETFHDTYYGFAATSVEKRDAPPPDYLKADMFEGQLIRLMKLKDYAYFDATNEGLSDCSDPSRSVWVCRFYDEDVFKNRVRSIEEHAEDLRRIILETIPSRLKECGLSLGNKNADYKVILIAHSMGGLVCRTLIQNLLPARKIDPKSVIHRLVTLGTPHRGIDLGRIPDFMERFVLRKMNPFNANIFEEKRMLEYLKLGKGYEPHSLGDPASPYAFPPKRCLSVIGSDHESYGVVQHATGNFSDGLVKQDRAYVVSGKPDKNGKYSFEQKGFWANVHRSHSGRRGIVNSYESFENIHRFLFGNIRADITFEVESIATPVEPKTEYFYDLEFSISIRGLPVYLHRREQRPCENAIRYSRGDLEKKRVLLHTLFMNSALKSTKTDYSHFKLEFRVRELGVKKGMLWDKEYPEKTIYFEDLEIRVGDFDADLPGEEVQYRWLSDGEGWKDAQALKGAL
jgi:pimeloyl-ACP methyl ester carboxylesterase